MTSANTAEFKNCVKCNQSKRTTLFLKRGGGEKGTRSVCKTCRVKPIVTKPARVTKVCCGCKKELPIDAFLEKRMGRCKPCRSKYHVAAANVRSNFMRSLWNATKNSSNKRAAKGRDYEHTLTFDDVTSKWDAQGGRCSITGVDMVTMPNSDFKCSIERLDNGIGYTNDNTVLCCREVNTSAQWNAVKAEAFFGYHNYEPILFDEYEFTKPKKTNAGIKCKRWVENADGTVHCHKCERTLPRSQFKPDATQICQGCLDCRTRAKRTWKYALYILLGNAKNKRRGSQSRRNVTCDLTIDDLIRKLLDQAGLCAYSGHPMRIFDDDFKMSLERIDSKLNYTVDNVCLICFEFNSDDRTRVRSEDTNQGSTGWSKDKFEYVRDVYRSRKMQADA